MAVMTLLISDNKVISNVRFEPLYDFESRARGGTWDGAATYLPGTLSSPDTSFITGTRALTKAPARRDGPALARRLRLDSGRGCLRYRSTSSCR